jgi:hypothetical protein
VIDWICVFCGHIVRDRIYAPPYCALCGLSKFETARAGRASLHARPGVLPRNPSAQALLSSIQRRRPTLPIRPLRERRQAKRVEPKERLGVLLSRTAHVEALDISTIGLLVEHTGPFKPGSMCEVELWRAGQRVRFRAEVIRTFVSTCGGRHGGIRYRTALRFLDAAQAVFDLLPELREDSGQRRGLPSTS